MSKPCAGTYELARVYWLITHGSPSYAQVPVRTVLIRVYSPEQLMTLEIWVAVTSTRSCLVRECMLVSEIAYVARKVLLVLMTPR